VAQAFEKIIVTVSPKEFFEVISDYESYPQFISALTGVKVLKRGKNRAVVEFEANLVRPFRYTLELKEKAPSSLSWKLLNGDFIRKNTGRWSLTSKGKKTEAMYEIDVELSRLVPGFVTSLLVKESLPKTLQEFRMRAEGIKNKRKED